ncbi:sensor domain-containing diguanylate cyclase [Pseudoneobacillus sp. C159]
MEERLEHVPCGFVSITSKGIITLVNQTFLDMVGYEKNQLLNQHIESIMSGANKFLFHTYFYPYIQLYGHVDELYLTIRNSKGEDLPILLNGKRNRIGDSEFIDCVFVKMDKRIDYENELRNAKRQIEEAYRAKDEALAKLEVLHKDVEAKQTELMALNKELVRLATSDPLTGLKNRRFLFETIDKYIAEFTVTSTPFSILIIDIDYFKNVNDTWGHLVGDHILRELAKIMQAGLRKEDIPGRYGGEEFMILLPNTNAEASKMIGEKVRLAVETAVWDQCSVTVSIGAATFSPEDTNLTIISNADKALYTSKANGRNCVTHSLELF